MMKCLGMTSTSHLPDASAFQRYVDTLASTLTTSQCDALDVLLPAGAPHAGAVGSESLL
jgi:hypothetical protein